MVQNPKGGGLSSSIGGSQQLGGVQKTTDFLDKSTWVLAGSLITLILLSSLSFSGSLSDNKSLIEPVTPQTETTKSDKAATPAAGSSTTTTATKPAATPATPEKN